MANGRGPHLPPEAWPCHHQFWEGKFVGGQKSWPWPKWLGTKTHHETSLYFLPFFSGKKRWKVEIPAIFVGRKDVIWMMSWTLLNSCTFRSHNMHPQFPCTEGCFQGCVPVVQQQPRENAIIIVKFWVHSGQKKWPIAGNRRLRTDTLKLNMIKWDTPRDTFFCPSKNW